MLTCKLISKSYNETPVLKDVSLILPRAETRVLMGHSGCGKTTLLRCLSMIESADAGTVTVDNFQLPFPAKSKQLRSYRKSLKSTVSLVFQQLFLWPNMTCRENLEIVSTASDKITAMSRYLDVYEVLDRYPQHCSLGQKQRIAFIRAILPEPRYLLCDEITSALDFRSASKVLTLLAEFTSQGLGVLLITHDSDIISLLHAPQVIKMESGRIIDTPTVRRPAAIGGVP